MSTCWHDLLYSLRSLRKARAFTITAIATLALGVGANSAIFSVVNAVLLQPVPFADSERIVHLAWEGNGHFQPLSATKFQYWREHAQSLVAMATWRPASARTSAVADGAALHAWEVSADFVEVSAYTPMHGPGFAPTDFLPGRPSTAIISHAVWERHFARPADLTGLTILVGSETVPIVGVLPDSFAFPYEDEPVDVIVPLHIEVDPNDNAEDWKTIARLRDGVSHSQASAEVSGLMTSFRDAYPNQVSDKDSGMKLATFNELYVARGVQRALWILMGAVAFVLLIANANVANLFLSRATERRREIAVRAALGASQMRVARLVLTESVIVAFAAAAVGLGLGTWVTDTLVALVPAEIPRLASSGIDWRVLAFTVGISFVTSLLFGGVSAWPALRVRLAPVLNEASRGSSRPGRTRFGLLVIQSALAMILLVGAGLLVVTLSRLASFDRGFDVENLIVARLTTPLAAGATSQQLWEFEQNVFRHIERLPAVVSFTAANSLPLERGINTPIAVVGKPEAMGTVEWRAVTPRYFETLGIKRNTGRSFEVTDAAGRPPVAIVNEGFARAYLAGANPLGQRVEIGRMKSGQFIPGMEPSAVEVIGVVADVRDVSLRSEPRRTIYVPQAQASSLLSTLSRNRPLFIARHEALAENLSQSLRDAVRAVDPSLPPPHVFPLSTVLARSLARERFGAALLSVFAALALALTAVGIYGVLAYTIQQRRREIGIRVALGASAAQISKQVMVQGVVPVFIGLAIGVAGAIGLSRFVAGFLWGVTPTDPNTFWSVAAILLAVAACASWIPARIAAKQDPVSALAHD